MNADPNARDKLLNDLNSTLTPASEPVSETPLAPPVIPDHELIRRIGRGSYGEVWLARTTLGTWRAVKIVHRAAFDHDRPYEREFEGIRRFEPISRTHPSQLNVLHVGRNDAAGHFYYVMELADDAAPDPKSEIRNPKEARDPNAETFSPDAEVRASAFGFPSDFGLRNSDFYQPRTLRSDLYHRGRLPFDECLQIGLALATALDHLHRHGLVHRDIKPSNIVFVNGIPKLADIGLVARAEATLSLVGTEGYLPPEGPGTVQADIFSLGKVLYEMATGRDRQEFPELPTNLIQQPAAERAQLAELNEIILRACHADLKQRYETAAELHAELALLQSGKSVSRMRTVGRRVRTLARAGALVTAMAVLAGGGWLWQQRQTREARQLATENARLGEENRQRIVRLDMANGIRLLDEGDPAAALLWFADALPLVTDNRAEESIHRMRIQQTIEQTPRVLRVLPHESGLFCSAFSPNGRFVATGTRDGNLRVWNAADGALVWGPKAMGVGVRFVRFSRDGQRLFACSSGEQGAFNGEVPTRNFFAVLDAESGREVFPASKVLPGISTDLICSSYSPDDRWLATSQKDHVIRLFDLGNRRLLTELRGHTNEVRFLSFSADGSLLASASLDRTVRLWRLPSGEPVGSPLEHRLPVVRAILTDDGQRLITASFARPGSYMGSSSQAGENEIQAWDVSTRRRLGNPMKGRDWIVMFVAPAHQGRFFASERAYDFDSPAEVLFRLGMDYSQCWAFSKDGSQLALGGSDYTARIFDAKTGALLAGPFRHGSSVQAVQFSPDENLLLTASDDGNARLWDLRHAPRESARHTLPTPILKLNAEYFGRQVGRLAGRTPILLKDGTLRIIGDHLEELHRFTSPEPGTASADLASARHSNIWSLCRYGVGTNDPAALFLWREDGEEVRQFTLRHPDQIYDHVFTPDDHYLVTYCRDRVVRFWRTSDGKLERTVQAPKSGDGDIHTLSPDGRTALWRQSVPRGEPHVFEHSIRFVDLESGKLIGDSHELPGTITGVVPSPDGKQVAIMDANGPVTVLEARTGRVISSAIKHSDNLSWVEWDPDGRRLLTAGHNEEVLVWDVVTGAQLLGPLRTPGGIIRVARWSPDGRFIITRNNDKKVRVWDAATGEAVTPLLKHSGDVAFAFMTHSNHLITASEPDLLRAWDLKETTLPPEVLADYAKFVSGRRLNASGVTLALKPEELAELSRSLRARAPQLFQ